MGEISRKRRREKESQRRREIQREEETLQNHFYIALKNLLTVLNLLWFLLKNLQPQHIHWEELYLFYLHYQDVFSYSFSHLLIIFQVFCSMGSFPCCSRLVLALLGATAESVYVSVSLWICELFEGRALRPPEHSSWKINVDLTGSSLGHQDSQILRPNVTIQDFASWVMEAWFTLLPCRRSSQAIFQKLSALQCPSFWVEANG